jgi:glycosyltransferase involved in cell wall biosynthesis
LRADQAHLEPVAAARPRVTMVVLTFNQERLVEHAVAAALAQTYSPLVIVFSDDASSDGTFAVIERLCAAYRGPHEVRCVRNPVNLGISKHVNRINEIAEGDLIVLAAGDDVSVPRRVERLVECWLQGGRRAHYLCSPVRAMTEDGQLQGEYQSPGFGARKSALAAGLCAYPISIGASEAWTKVLAQRFPPLSPDVWAEDQVFGFRGRLLGPIGSVDEPLVHYRSGTGIVSSQRRFELRRYVKNQLRGLWVYRQRARDALHCGRPVLASVIAAKFTMLFLLLPISPLLSVLRRSRVLRPITQYL